MIEIVKDFLALNCEERRELLNDIARQSVVLFVTIGARTVILKRKIISMRKYIQ